MTHKINKLKTVEMSGAGIKMWKFVWLELECCSVHIYCWVSSLIGQLAVCAVSGAGGLDFIIDCSQIGGHKSF